jgi:hypothetical protein
MKKRWSALTLLALAGAASGCHPEPPGTSVVLNERLFRLPSMESAGKGCTTYQLEEHPSEILATGTGNIAGLIVSQRSGGDHVLIQVTEDRRVVAERRYPEDFFRAGRLDEFTVQGSSGEQELLRYWGSLAPDGVVQCSSFDDDGDAAR